MKTTRVFVFLASIAFLAAPALADQSGISSSASPQLPNGISVVATGISNEPSVLASFQIALSGKEENPSWLARLSKSEAAIAKLKASFAAGAVVDAVPNMMEPTLATATLRLPTTDLDKAEGILKALHWVTQGQMSIGPADPDGARNRALANAELIAHDRAEAIAVASGRHIGRLVNVSPTPLDLVGPLAAMASYQLFTTQLSSTVNATAIFTFELAP